MFIKEILLKTPNNHLNFSLFIATLLIILGSKSLYYETYGQNSLLLGIALFVTYLAIKYKILVNKKITLFATFFFILASINPEAKLESLGVLILRLYIAIIFVSLIDFKSFSYYLYNIVTVIGLFSLLSIPIIYFNIESPLPEFIGTDERLLQNFIFFGVSFNFLEYGIFRNSGLWWEPGAFAVFITLSMIFLVIHQELTKKRYIILSIIMLSTASTSIMLAYLLLSAAMIKKIRKRHLIIALVGLPVFSYFVATLILPNIIEKLDGTNASFTSRYNDLIISLAMLKENFLIGYGFGSQIENAIPFGEALLGYHNYYAGSGAKPTGSDGLTMLLAQLGFLSLFIILPFLYPKYIHHLRTHQKILIALSLFIIFNSQNFTFLLIFAVLLLYAIKPIKKHEYITCA